jgi:pyruvate formate lyase activating enzyme
VTACAQGAISWDGERQVTDKTKCVVCLSCAAVCHAEARECVGREMTVDEIIAVAERDIAFYEESGGGVTFSGGEPLAQPDFLLALLRACREKGIHTAVDTCGLGAWETLERIREYVDLFMYDLKLMDEARHRKFTGVSNDLIVRNLKALVNRGHNIVLRVPIIPGINDDDESMRQIGGFAAALPRLSAIDLLPYHHIGLDKYTRLDRTYRLPETRPPSDERMAEIAALLSELGLRVRT